LQRFERILLFVLLLFGSGAEQGLMGAPTPGASSEGQPVIQLVFGLIYLAVILLLLKKFTKPLLFLIRKEKWTFALCLWVFASVAWSVEPAETFRRALALAGTSIAGLYIGLRYEPNQQHRMIAFVVGLGAVASLAAGLLFPGSAIESGTLEGIYHNKNTLGTEMALGLLCFALLLLGQRKHRLRHAAMLVLCGIALILSRSATAIVVTFLMLALLPLRKIINLRIGPFIYMMTVSGVAITSIFFWTVGHLDMILQTLGRDSSLTGRIPLWQLVTKEIGERPFQGYGFSAFWTSSEGQRVSDTVAWDVAVPHAHNGFLEVWLGIGLIGLCILVVGMLRNLFLAVRVARTNRGIDQAWPLVLLIFVILYNLTENSLLTVNSLIWMTYVANSFWLVRNLEEEKFVHESAEHNEFAYSS
jgi:exopolysaccharide production protein ExoQ